MFRGDLSSPWYLSSTSDPMDFDIEPPVVLQ